jgi:hypothetical protein
MENRRFRWNGKFWALVILLAIISVAFFSCKQKTVEVNFSKKLDSLGAVIYYQDQEIITIKKNQLRYDSALIKNHKKVNHGTKHIESFDNVSLKRYSDSINRANNLN